MPMQLDMCPVHPKVSDACVVPPFQVVLTHIE